jgi:hypothetical protein
MRATARGLAGGVAGADKGPAAAEDHATRARGRSYRRAAEEDAADTRGRLGDQVVAAEQDAEDAQA